MPELPEVQTIVDALRERIMGKTITGLAVRFTCRQRMMKIPSQELYDAIVLQTVQTVLRRGKYILLPLSNGHVLVFHLGMTGRLLVQQSGAECLSERVRYDNLSPEHAHFVLELVDFLGTTPEEGYVDDVELYFCDPRRFGKILFARDVQNIEQVDLPGIRDLGSDALSISVDEFSALVSKSKRPVKALLLDQTKVAGIGNIYADEACFAAKIHPARQAASLTSTESAKLWFAVKTVLKEGIYYGGSSVSDYTSIDGTKGSYQQQHRVYGKLGVPCVVCQDPIQRTKLAGRSSHFCPSCQPLEIQ